jgi:hypothetical protein
MDLIIIEHALRRLPCKLNPMEMDRMGCAVNPCTLHVGCSPLSAATRVHL